jgi:ribosomal protein S18 acetylase RimI-like enzyme
MPSVDHSPEQINDPEGPAFTPPPPTYRTTMEVEPATMDDVDAVADLWVSLARGQRAHGSHLRSEANRATVRDAVSRHVVTGGVLVARDPSVVGFVMFGPEAGTYEQDVSRGVVHNLFVRSGHRGEGVGGDLLAAAEARLAAEGADVVALEVMADNDAARRFYGRAGYRPHRVELEKRVESDTLTTDEG